MPESRNNLQIRWSRREDRDDIIMLIKNTGFFHENEIQIAREVLDDALRAGQEGDYQSYTALLDDTPAGWMCFGPTPCTQGTFDLYWIAVGINIQGRGVGRALMELAEKQISLRNGRLIIVETAGRDEYEPTRMFYKRLGYSKAAEIPDFYAPGDAKIVFVKYL